MRCQYLRRNSCEYPKVQRGPSPVLTKRLRALQSVRFRAWAGTLVIGSHVLRLAPRVQRISMPRSPLSKIKDQGGCERSVCFHQKLCESRRRAARADILFVPIFLMALFSSFQEFLRLSWRVELSQYLFDECSDLCIGRTRERPQQSLRVKNSTTRHGMERNLKNATMETVRTMELRT